LGWGPLGESSSSPREGARRSFPIDSERSSGHCPVKPSINSSTGSGDPQPPRAVQSHRVSSVGVGRSWPRHDFPRPQPHRISRGRETSHRSPAAGSCHVPPTPLETPSACLSPFDCTGPRAIHPHRRTSTRVEPPGGRISTRSPTIARGKPPRACVRPPTRSVIAQRRGPGESDPLREGWFRRPVHWIAAVRGARFGRGERPPSPSVGATAMLRLDRSGRADQ
jgi:hypothetical protein